MSEKSSNEMATLRKCGDEIRRTLRNAEDSMQVAALIRYDAPATPKESVSARGSTSEKSDPTSALCLNDDRWAVSGAMSSLVANVAKAAQILTFKLAALDAAIDKHQDVN